MQVLSLAFFLISFAYAQVSSQSTACGTALNATQPLNATLAHDCLLSVPFNATVASQFIKYYKDTLQFQSTLTYLKDPPASYQQPAVDVLGGLDSIQQQIDDGTFQNEYEFEVAVQKLVQATHDGHVSLFAGALSVFTFGSPLSITSVSSNGIELPKVYNADDLLIAQSNSTGWTPSAITAINGQEVTQFLSQFAAANAFGTLEAHSDWNQLMASPAADIQGLPSAFTGASPFYPGDTIEFKFENGSVVGPTPWLALFNIPDETPIINTGQDFFDFFVLGIFPTSEDDASQTAVPTAAGTAAATDIFTFAASPSTAVPTTAASAVPTDDPTIDDPSLDDEEDEEPASWDNPGYPNNPDVIQPNLGFVNGGVLTGYFLNATSVGVLSIPNFELSPESVQSFSATVGEFLRRSKEAGLKNIVIDLQQNGGGDSLLATDTFKQFFPNIDPFGGNRLRAHPTADALGNTFTTFFDTQQMNGSFYTAMAADVFTATDYINTDTGRNFTSWAEFFGPHPDHGDFFTTPQRDNLSSTVFDIQASGGILVAGFANRTISTPPPYAAEDIILLTDGLCSSTCSQFVEMMHHEAGVRTVVAGGLPQSGPMQTPGGTRGAQVYSSFDLDSDIEVAEDYLNTSISSVLPSRDLSFLLIQANINLRDQVRRGKNFPLQFAYEAADCRIFFTPQTFYSYQSLWQYTVDAVYNNPSLCVQGSTGTTTASDPTISTAVNSTGSTITNSSQVATYPIAAPHVAESPKSKTSSKIMTDADAAFKLNGDVDDFVFQAPTLEKFCETNSDCEKLQVCLKTEFCVNGRVQTAKICKKSCRDNRSCGSSQRNLYCNTKERFCKGNKPCVFAGFCESLVASRPDKLCAKLKTLPAPNPNAAADGVVVVQPDTPQVGEVDDAVGKPVTKEDYMKIGTAGAVVLAGMAPWAHAGS